MADIGDPGVREQLREKYPQRGRELPARVERRRCVDGLGGLRDDLKSLDRGVAPGCGGLRNEFLKVLANKMTQEQMQLMEMFGVRYLGGGAARVVLLCLAECAVCGLVQDHDEGHSAPNWHQEPSGQVLP